MKTMIRSSDSAADGVRRWRKRTLWAMLVACTLAVLTLFSPTWRVQNVSSSVGVAAKAGFLTGGSEPVAEARESFGNLPLNFEANRGQTDRQVKFLSRGRGYTLFLTNSGAVLKLRNLSAMAAPAISQKFGSKDLLFGPKTFAAEYESRTARPQPQPPTAVHMELVGANPNAPVAGLSELPGKSNYFIGDDPKKWHTNVPTYARVEYKNVYPDINLMYHGRHSQLEYDFVVAPGADPRVITLKVKLEHSKLAAARGQTETRARIDAQGDLVVPAEVGEVRFQKPVAYQLISSSGTQSSRSYVDCRYVFLEGGKIGFEVAAYDESKALTIDPVLAYSSYLGGSMDDFGNAITVDGLGNIYVTGGTTSTNFPVTSGVVQTTYGGADGGYQSVNGDVFVTKLSPDGSTMVYSTYLGGAGDENAYGIVADVAGNVYLTGGTNSSNFPTTPGVYQPACCGLTDVFVTKLDPKGSSLLYSTHIGLAGEGIRGFGIAVDSAGSAYITGNAGPGFPTTPGAFQTASGAFTSAYVMKLNPAGSAADYSTFLSGGNIDYGESIDVDKSGNAYVTGYASSTGFPTTAGAFQTALGGGVDAFVTVLNPAGSALIYSTFLGGSANDEGFRIAVDSLGMAYVTGVTASSNFPTTSGAFQIAFGGGNTDAFIAKLDPTQSGAASLVYSTFLGGSGDENGQNFLRDILAVDSAGNAYVTGTTTSTNFPTVNPLQAAPGGGFDAYAAKLNPSGSDLIYSTYLGGSGDDFGRGIAVDGSANVYVTGQTSSANFPVTSTAFQAVFGGSTDAFVVKIIPVASLSQTTLTFANQPVGSTSAAQTTTLTNEKNTPLSITSVSASGDFAQTNTCGTSLGAGLTCSISVTFAPSAPLSRIGSVTITDDASNSPQIVALGGIGVGPAVTLSGSSISFGNRLITTSSTAQVVTLTNSGNAPLTISSIAIAGTNSGDFAQTNTCPTNGATLAANTNCAITLTFAPSATGTRAASLTITDDAPGSPHNVALTGTGTDYSLAAASGSNCPAGGNCFTSATISSGQMATYDLQITPNSGFSGTVALTCSGAPGSAVCSVSPISVPANGSSSYAFAVTVSNTSNAMAIPGLWVPRAPKFSVAYPPLVALLILVALLVLRSRHTGLPRQRVFRPAMAVILSGLLYSSGCGSTRPPTSATLTITGASGTVSRTLSLSLTINH